MKNVKISVIVPVYNIEKYLPKCLDSIISQTFKDFEVIIVNDGSTDGSQKIIDNYVCNDSRIFSLTQKNSGQGAARNYGLKYAKGDFITFIDGDDWVESNMFEEMYNLAINDKSDIVVCDYTLVYDNKTKNKYMSTLYEYNSCNVNNYILSTASPTFKIIKNELIKDANFKFPNIRAYEDIAVVGSLALYTNKISYLKKSFYNYYIRQGSTMNLKKYEEKMKDIFISFEIISKRFGEKFNDEIEFLYIQHLLHDASLRFIKYEEGQECLNKINSIMNQKYKEWYKNRYFKKQNIKYKIMCFLLYWKMYNFIKLISR